MVYIRGLSRRAWRWMEKGLLMKRIFVGLCGLVLFGLCSVASSAPRERAWSSTLVSGTLDINPDGSVRDYTMDQPDKIPGVVLAVIKKTVPAWRFDVDTSRNVIAQTKMSIRVVAKPVDDGKMAFGVEGVHFGRQDGEDTDQLRELSHPSPVYPRAAIKEFASATVYMVVRVGRDGRVMDLAAEQVNFTNRVAPSRRAYLEKIFTNASELALRRWTFDVPTSGPDAASPYWLARIPFAYSLRSWNSSNEPPAYGSWQPYVPGPRLATPGWMQEQTGLASAPDAIPDGGITPIRNGLHLAGSGHDR